jgi:hypothetical protein
MPSIGHWDLVIGISPSMGLLLDWDLGRRWVKLEETYSADHSFDWSDHMKRLPVVPVCLGLLVLGALIPVFAKAPEELKKAPVADLVVEAQEQIESIASLAESAASYTEKKDDIRRAAGVLAVLGQAIAEHPEGKSQKVSPLALREAARELVDSQDHESAQKAIQQIREALQGPSTKTQSKEVAYKDLISMDDLMHVVNTRNSQVIRAARRSRKPEEDSRHALTIAMLSIPMAEQAEDYLSEESEIAAWKKYALDFQTGMTDLAAAFKAKDAAGIKKHLDFATKACNDCHAQFRDTE